MFEQNVAIVSAQHSFIHRSLEFFKCKHKLSEYGHKPNVKTAKVTGSVDTIDWGI